MSIFVIAYYSLLLIGSSLAAFYNKRSVFLLLFSLTMVSFILGIIGGSGALVAVAPSVPGFWPWRPWHSYCFREALIMIAPAPKWPKSCAPHPLTASLRDVRDLHLRDHRHLRAGDRAIRRSRGDLVGLRTGRTKTCFWVPTSWAAICSAAIVYGARNTVGLALIATIAGVHPGRWSQAFWPPPRGAGSISSWAASPT